MKKKVIEIHCGNCGNKYNSYTICTCPYCGIDWSDIRFITENNYFITFCK